MSEISVESLRKNIIQYAKLVQDTIENVNTGFESKNRALLKNIIDKKENKINMSKEELDKQCFDLIEGKAPTGKNLRIVLSIVRMINDLERIGDHAVNIAEAAIEILKTHDNSILIETRKFEKSALELLKDSVFSFVNNDILMANDVINKDKMLDRLTYDSVKELIDFEKNYSGRVELANSYLRMAYNFERIGDLATNIAEYTIYIVEDRVV